MSDFSALHRKCFGNRNPVLLILACYFLPKALTFEQCFIILVLLMGKFCRLLFTFLFLSLIPAISFAVIAPQFDAAVNYSGPIVFFWNTSTNNVAATYLIFISTTSMNSFTFAQCQAAAIATQNRALCWYTSYQPERHMAEWGQRSDILRENRYR